MSLVDAPTRTLILTTPAFHTIFGKRIEGALAPGLRIELIPLPTEMQAEVDKVVANASREVSPLAVAEAIVAEELT